MKFTSKKLAIILQYTQIGLSTAISLIYTPIMLRLLGQGEYGLYSLAGSVISYLSLLSLGLGASYIRFYSRYRSKNDEAGIRLLNGTYLLTFLIIALVAFAGGLLLAFNIDKILTSGYTGAEIKLTRTLMLVMAVALSWSFPASVFQAYIMSQECFVFQKLISLLRTIVNPMLTLPVLFLGYGSLGLVLVSLFLTVFFDAICIHYCLSSLKMRFSFHHAGFQLLKEIAPFSLIIAINGIVDQVNWNVDKLIIAKFLNKESVAIYAVASNIGSLYLVFSVTISSVFTPRIHRIVSDNQPDKNQALTDIFIRIGRVQYILLLLILTGFIFFGEYFITHWAGEDYLLSYWVIILLIFPATIPLIQNAGIEIQRAENKHKFRMYVYVLMAATNVILSIILCQRWGVLGSTSATTLSIVLANGLIMNLYYHYKIGLDMLRFWKEIAKITLASVPVLLFGALVIHRLTYSSFFIFILWIFIYSAIFAGTMLLWGFNAEERQMILAPLKKILLICKKSES